MRKKNLLVILGCIVLAMVWCTASFAAEKVGYINLQRLVNESKMGKGAKADILKMRKTKQAVLDKKLADINKMREFINKKGDKLAANDRRNKVELLQKMYKEYQRLVADAKEDITREDRQLVAIILEKANDILKKVAKKKKYGIILKDPNSIGYLNPDVDITDLVLKELNKKK